MDHISAGRGVNATDLVGYVPSSGHTSSLRGPSPQALTLFGGVRFITWRRGRPYLGECRRGQRHFREFRARVGYGPALGSTLKRPCAILFRLVGRPINTVERNKMV